MSELPNCERPGVMGACSLALGHPGQCNNGGPVPAVAEPAHDPVNHPAHYTQHPSGVECIEVTRHMTFNLGNAVKYVWRAGEKGDAVEDLRKAVWYLTDEIARLGGAA